VTPTQKADTTISEERLRELRTRLHTAILGALDRGALLDLIDAELSRRLTVPPDVHTTLSDLHAMLADAGTIYDYFTRSEVITIQSAIALLQRQPPKAEGVV
jgi:hypothetical protein